MARKPRIHHSGAFYHVMLRGNNGQNIFFTNDDRYLFYDLIQEGIARYGYQMHAFCLMSNHVHFAIKVGDISISKIMQNLCFRYARLINNRQKRIGHLFQGRFKSKLVATNAYFFQLIKYIHLNPVKAKMVSVAEDYQWSSHRTYLNIEDISWLTTDLLLSHFGAMRKVSTENYIQFLHIEPRYKVVSDSISDAESRPSDALNLEQDQFVTNHITKQEDRVAPLPDVGCVIEFICKCFNVNEVQLKEPTKNQSHARARAAIASLLADFRINTLTSTARYFNRDVSGIIRTLRRLETDANFVAVLREIKERLIKSTSQA